MHTCVDDENECDYDENGGSVQLEPVRMTRDSHPAPNAGSDPLDSHLSAGDAHMEAVHDGLGAISPEVVASNYSQSPHFRLDTDTAPDQLQRDNHGDSASPRDSRKRRHSFSDSEDGRDRPKRSYRTASTFDGSSTSATPSNEDDRRSVFVQCSEFVHKDDVYKAFARFGRIERVDMPPRHSGHPIAFVHFLDDRDASDAVRQGQAHAFGILTVKPYRRRSMK